MYRVGDYVSSSARPRVEVDFEIKNDHRDLRLTGLLRELVDVSLRHPPHRRTQQEPERPGGGQSHVLLPPLRTSAIAHPAGTC